MMEKKDGVTSDDICLMKSSEDLPSEYYNYNTTLAEQFAARAKVGGLSIVRQYDSRFGIERKSLEIKLQSSMIYPSRRCG